MSDQGWRPEDGRIVALCGGIGGAKLALGLSHLVPAEKLTIIVNTADDFRHFGLHVSPDVDTVCYTLAELANTELGWGRKGESWRFMAAVEALGGETWFSLGDTDLATSAVRTARMEQGDRLTGITHDFARAMGIQATILPASDDPLATVVYTENGRTEFQRYFVGQRCAPRVERLEVEGIETAQPSAEVVAALDDPALGAVIICPSNPYLSIDPILGLSGIRPRLAALKAPILAVSPLVGNEAIKGPLAKMMHELGHEVSLQTIADHYRDFLDVLVIDRIDVDRKPDFPQVEPAQTVMQSLEERIELARTVLAIARKQAAQKQGR